MRWLPAVCLMLAASSVSARSLATFGTPRGGDRLQHVLPELGRVVGALLDARGLDLKADGRFEELPSDRVRLTLTYGGCDAAEEGMLEELDELARRLVDELAQMLAVRAKSAATADSKPEKASDVNAIKARTAPAPSRQPLTPGPRVPAAVVALPTPPAVDKPPLAVDKPAPPAADKPAPAAPEKTSAPTVAAVPAVATPAVTPPPAATPAAVAAVKEELLTPYASRGADESEARPRPTVAGRVVVHQVAEIPAAYGAGYVATHALFQFLRVKLRLQIVSSGLGMTPLGVATEEATRSQARATIMARLIGVETQPQNLASEGSVRCRLEVVVVRDGRTVLRRLVDGMAEQSRDPRRRADPVFFAVTQSLETIQSELASVLAE